MKHSLLLTLFSIVLFSTEISYSQPLQDSLLWFTANNSRYASISSNNKWVLMQSDSVVSVPNFSNRRPATLRDLESGDPLLDFINLEKDGQFIKAKFSPDNQYVVTSNDYGYFFIWNIEQHQIIKSWELTNEAVLDFEFSEDGKQIISFTYASDTQIHRIAAWEFPSGKMIWEHKTKGSSTFQYINNSSILYIETQYFDYDIQTMFNDRYFLDPHTGKVIRELTNEKTILPGRMYSENGNYYTQTIETSTNTSSTYTINIYDSKDDKLIFAIPNPDTLLSQPYVVGMHPDGNFIFVNFFIKQHNEYGYRSVNNTEVWNFVTKVKVKTYQYTNYPRVRYTFLRFSKDLRYLLMSTGGSVEVFKSDWNITSIETNEENNSFGLSVISNNPASTKISYALLKDSDINLSMFDIQGRLIVTLKKGYFHSGEENFYQDFSKLTQGTYFIQLTADGKTETQKILIK